MSLPLFVPVLCLSSSQEPVFDCLSTLKLLEMPSFRSSKLSQGYGASFDLSSDEETDVHVGVNCNAFSGKMDYSFVQSTSKVDKKTLLPRETTESCSPLGDSLPTELGSLPTSNTSDGREEEQMKCKQVSPANLTLIIAYIT